MKFRETTLHGVVGIAVAFSLSFAHEVCAQVVTQTLPYGAAEMQINQASGAVYVANNNHACSPAPQNINVLKIDPTTNQVVPIANTNTATTIAIDDVASKVYFACATTGTIQALDETTGTLTQFDLVPAGATTNEGVLKLFVSPASGNLYAIGGVGTSWALYSINEASQTVTSQIPLPPELFAAYASAPGVYASTLQYPFNVQSKPLALFASDFDHNKIYAVDDRTSALYVMDLAASALTVQPGASSDSGAFAIAVDPGISRVFVLNTVNSVFGFGAVDIFDANSGSILTTRQTRPAPGSIVVNPSTHWVFVGNGDATAHSPASITIIDQNLNPYTMSLNLGGDDGTFNAGWLVIDPDLNKVFIGSSTLSRYALVLDCSSLQIGAVDNLATAATAVIRHSTHTLFAGVGNAVTPGIALVDESGGTMPVASVYPKNLSFTAGLGASSAPKSVYLANVGGAPMTVTNLEYADGYNSIEQQNDCSNPILPGQVCPITLVFAPTNPAAGSPSALYYFQIASPGQDITLQPSTSITH
jgi:hypothetical protein